jgi:alkyl hydroperoxide reductase subunit AhpC
MPNAIERIEDALVDGDQGRKAREALAAVDALYRAAKKVEAVLPFLPPKNAQSMTPEQHQAVRAYDALAAAVRRVDGEA